MPSRTVIAGKRPRHLRQRALHRLIGDRRRAAAQPPATEPIIRKAPPRSDERRAWAARKRWKTAVDMDAEGIAPIGACWRSVILPGLAPPAAGDDIVEAAEARAGQLDQRGSRRRLGGVGVVNCSTSASRPQARRA